MYRIRHRPARCALRCPGNGHGSPGIRSRGRRLATPRLQSPAMNEKVAKCLLVAKVLVADGIMTDEERDFLESMIASEGLSADERRRVIELDGFDDAERVIARLPAEQRRALIERLVDAASADGRLSQY